MGGGTPALEILLGTLPLLATLFIHGVGMYAVQRAFQLRGTRIYRSRDTGVGQPSSRPRSS